MSEKGFSLNGLSRTIEQNTAYMSQYLNGGRPLVLTDTNVLARLSRTLEIPENELRPPLDGLQSKFNAPMITSHATDAFGARDVPVIRASTVGGCVTIDFSDAVPRPENLVGQANVSAVIMPDDALSPTYRANDVLYFSPGMPRVGDGCLVDRKGDLPVVGIFQSASAQAVELIDGTGGTIAILRSDVRAILRERAVLRG